MAKPKANVVAPRNDSPDSSIRFNDNDWYDTLKPITGGETTGCLVDEHMCVSCALHEHHGSHLA